MRKFAGKIILYSNVLFALLLLLSYAAPLVDPGKILFPAYLALIYPFLLLVNLAFVIYWVLRFRKEVLLSLLVILLGWGHLTNLFPMNNLKSKEVDNSGSGTAVKIMSYNVRTFDRFRWSKKGDTRENILQLINEQDADITCIQEFFSRDKKGMREDDIREKIGDYPYHSVYYLIRTNVKAGYGMATFSKHPILKTSRIPFDNSTNRAFYTDILLDQDTIRLFNIHLQSIKLIQKNYSFLDSLTLKASNKQLEEMKDIGNRLREAFVLRAEQSKIIHNYIVDSPYPVIVAGDFNDVPLSFAYKKIQKGLEDSFRKTGKGLGNTYAGDLPSLRIDYILHSNEFESVAFTRIKSKFSDHFPIVATIRKKDKEADSK